MTDINDQSAGLKKKKKKKNSNHIYEPISTSTTNKERTRGERVKQDQVYIIPAMSGKYSTNPEWASIEPIPLNDGNPENGVTPLATIAYPPDYLEGTSYLRAVMAANEMSERALRLTGDLIMMNPAHYTVWLVTGF